MADKKSKLLAKGSPSLDEVLLTPEQVAMRWSITTATLANMRSQGRGPQFRRIGPRAVRYPDWAVFAYEVGEAA